MSWHPLDGEDPQTEQQQPKRNKDELGPWEEQSRSTSKQGITRIKEVRRDGTGKIRKRRTRVIRPGKTIRPIRPRCEDVWDGQSDGSEVHRTSGIRKTHNSDPEL